MDFQATTTTTKTEYLPATNPLDATWCEDTMLVRGGSDILAETL